MAADDFITVAFDKQELDDTISCCICTNVYTEPKALPCLHTFCMKCLQQIGLKTNKGPGDEMPCPICRQQFKIPLQSFQGLPKNFVIARLIQVANVSDPSTSSTSLCNACLEDNEKDGKDIPKADLYCVECKQNLCEECCRHHRKVTLTKNHKLVPLNEHQESDDNAMANLALTVCELHEQKVIDIYCAECKTVVCAVCFIDGHRNHEGSHVSKFVDVFRKQIENNIETINHCSSQTQMKKEELIKVKEKMQQKVEMLEMDVINRRDKVKQFVETQANALLQSLCSIRQSKLKEIQLEADDIQANLPCLQSYSSYCQKILAKGSASDICQAVSDLSVRAIKLQQHCQSLIEREIIPFTFCFTKSKFEEVWEEDNVIGEIQEECNSRQKKASTTERTVERNAMETLMKGEEQAKKDCEKTDCKNKITEIKLEREEERNASMREKEQLIIQLQEQQKSIGKFRFKLDPILVQTIRTKATEEKKSIGGLTILDEEFFVFSDKSSEVEVYDSVKFSFSRRWKLMELIVPYDMASCSRNQCLYIFDYKGTYKSKEILRVDSCGKLIKRWSTGKDYGWCLSVTGESNVILTVSDKHKLNEYSPAGRLIREINLSSNKGLRWPTRSQCVRYPVHAIRLSSGHFVVSHGDSDDDLHRVCIVDGDGKLMKSFGGKRGSTIGQMNEPVHLAVDENGFVMVADQYNRRVLILDSDLKFKREILSGEKHELRGPHGILLYQKNNRLFVADSNSDDGGRILIFEFR